MKKILFIILYLVFFSPIIFGEEGQINPDLMTIMQGGIACESYLDGKFNKTISSVYFDLGNKKIHQISIQSWLPITPEEPATIAFQTLNVDEMDILGPKRITFRGTNDAGYKFNADISFLDPTKIIFNLKIAGRGIVEIKNIGKQGLELKKQLAPGIYLGETNPQ